MPVSINGTTNRIVGDIQGNLTGTASSVTDGAITRPKIGYSGAVLQVVQNTKVDVFSSTSNSFVDITGLNAAITPTSSTTSVLVTVHINVSGFTWNGGPIMFLLLRDNVSIFTGTGGDAPVTAVWTGWSDAGNTAGVIETFSFHYLDNTRPASTNPVTYKIQGRTQNSGGWTWYINRRATTYAAGSNQSGTSAITLMELRS